MKNSMVLLMLIILTPFMSIADDCTVGTVDRFAGALLEQIGYTPVYDSLAPATSKLVVKVANVWMDDCSDLNGDGVHQFLVYATLYKNGEVIDKVIGADYSTGDTEEVRLTCASRAGSIANAILKLKRCQQ